MPAAQPLPDLMEVYAVAYHLKCSHEQVWRLIRKGLLPAHRLFGARGLRVDRADLLAYIAAQRLVADLFGGPDEQLPPADRRETPRAPASDRRARRRPSTADAIEAEIERGELAIDQRVIALTAVKKRA